MGSQTLHCHSHKTPTDKGSILDPGVDPRVHQPPRGRGAPPSPRAHPSTSETLGVGRFTGAGGLSLEGELRAQDQGQGRQSFPEGDSGAERPDRSVGGGGKDCPGGAGQV